MYNLNFPLKLKPSKTDSTCFEHPIPFRFEYNEAGRNQTTQLGKVKDKSLMTVIVLLFIIEPVQ